jgi:hypothetical protein
MARPRTRNVVFVLLTIGATVWGVFDGLGASEGESLVTRVAYIGGYVLSYFTFVILPFGILLLAWIKSREMKRERDAMDETITENPEGEEKLRHMLASKQSLEAQIGLVEQSHDHDKVNILRDVPDDDPRDQTK